jgi:hypothetical protein
MLWGASKAVFVGVVSGVVVMLAIVFGSAGADAKSSYESPYGYDRTWQAAVRFVVVDMGWKVTDKDKDNGYISFDYRSPESSKASPGTFELVRGSDADAPVSVLAQLPDMPHYHEEVILDGLKTKMRREYGDPPEHKKKPPAEAPPSDGGAGDAAPE